MPEYIRLNLAEKLISNGLITREQFDLALKKHWETKVFLRQILVDNGFISEEKLTDFMHASLGIPVVYDIVSRVNDPQVFQLIPEKICRQYWAIPFAKEKNVLQVAMVDPLDVFAIDDLERIARCKIEVAMSKRENISQAIDKFYGSKQPIEEIIRGAAQKAEEMDAIREENAESPSSDNVVVAEEAPIIRLVDTMIQQAVQERASDVHVEPEESKLRIRFRVDGGLREAMIPPKSLQELIISRIKIIAGMDISIKRSPQDGRFKIRIDEKDIDVRVSTIPTTYGEKVVMRLLDQTSVRKGLEDAGFDERILKQFKAMIERPFGIILVTGPTGSGKTTTLYLALQIINSPDKNIITLEDPVEYELKGINQISVNVKAGVTFAEGLKSILRQDPDVIMIGEIRDFETADIAVRAALTGHLVFSTLHTNDAPSSIVRLVDMNLPPFLVASSICGVLAQRLVRAICPQCKKSFKLSERDLESTGLDKKALEFTFYRGDGCEKCRNTGYWGRIGIFELMVVDRELRALIHANKTSDEIRALAQKEGMKTLWEDGFEKALRGLTTIEEVRRVTFSEE